MEIKKTAVIGGGVTGRQIALNTALHSIDTYHRYSRCSDRKAGPLGGAVPDRTGTEGTSDA